MLDVVLVAPQIATNTGNIIRLCANTGARLHLVRPLGFALDDASLRRAGLDYHELADTTVHDHFTACRAALGDRRGRWFATTARPPATRYDAIEHEEVDVVVFGCEATGLPDDLLSQFAPEQRLHIPMRAGNRSLNLANAVAVVVYEAWRRHGFAGAGPHEVTGTFAEWPRGS